MRAVDGPWRQSYVEEPRGPEEQAAVLWRPSGHVTGPYGDVTIDVYPLFVGGSDDVADSVPAGATSLFPLISGRPTVLFDGRGFTVGARIRCAMGNGGARYAEEYYVLLGSAGDVAELRGFLGRFCAGHGRVFFKTGAPDINDVADAAGYDSFVAGWVLRAPAVLAWEYGVPRGNPYGGVDGILESMSALRYACGGRRLDGGPVPANPLMQALASIRASGGPAPDRHGIVTMLDAQRRAGIEHEGPGCWGEYMASCIPCIESDALPGREHAASLLLNEMWRILRFGDVVAKFRRDWDDYDGDDYADSRRCVPDRSELVSAARGLVPKLPPDDRRQPDELLLEDLADWLAGPVGRYMDVCAENLRMTEYELGDSSDTVRASRHVERYMNGNVRRALADKLGR